MHLHRLATGILAAHNHLCRAADLVAGIAWNAQAGLGADLLALGLDDLWIDHRHLFIFVLGYEDAQRESYLRGRQARAMARMHGLKHIIDQLLNRSVETMNLFAFLP